MSSLKVRSRAARLGLIATVGLTFFKFTVGMLSGSIGVLSEGIHSSLDLVSASVTFFTVPHSVKPADDDHPFGHGKFETISSLFEALLLVLAAVLIFYEALIHFRKPTPVEHQWLAIFTILTSMAVSFWVYRQSLAASRAADSSALRVNALHFYSDVLASVGVLIGLCFLKLTGWLWIDPLIAIVVALYILFVAVGQVKQSIRELSDTQLPEAEIRDIRELLDSFGDRMIEAHGLRSRKSGAFRHVDFHLVVCGAWTVERAHEVCDEMEETIQAQYPGTSVSIHVEPCAHVRGKVCRESCPIFEASPSQDQRLS